MVNTVIIGAGGHARVIVDILQHDKNIKIIGCIDKQKKKGETVLGYPLLGEFKMLPQLIKKYGINAAVVGVGDNNVRAGYYQQLKKMKLKLINAIHPRASIAENAVIGDGNVICREAVICTCAKIGNNCIINTGAIVEHDCVIEDHAHVAPGVNIAGRVTIGEGTFVGIGATIIHFINIGKHSIIGAGAILTNNIPSNVVAVGQPAMVIKKVSDKEWFDSRQAMKKR